VANIHRKAIKVCVGSIDNCTSPVFSTSRFRAITLLQVFGSPALNGRANWVQGRKSCQHLCFIAHCKKHSRNAVTTNCICTTKPIRQHYPRVEIRLWMGSPLFLVLAEHYVWQCLHYLPVWEAARGWQGSDKFWNETCQSKCMALLTSYTFTSKYSFYKLPRYTTEASYGHTASRALLDFT